MNNNLCRENVEVIRDYTEINESLLKIISISHNIKANMKAKTSKNMLIKSLMLNL